MGGARVVIDFGVSIDNGNLDAQVAGEQDAEKETRRAGARDNDLFALAESSYGAIGEVTLLIFGMAIGYGGCSQFHTVSLYLVQSIRPYNTRLRITMWGRHKVVLQHRGRDGFSMLLSIPAAPRCGERGGGVEWKCPTCHLSPEVAKKIT